MPTNSFSLIFDGDPAPDQTSQLFEIVKEDAAWQVAQSQWFAEISLKPGILQKMEGCFFLSKVFPQVISDIIEGKSFVRCNFPTGDMYDPERVLNMNRNLEAPESVPGLDWLRAWMQDGHFRNPNPFKPAPPLLPSFSDYAIDEIIPEGSEQTV